MARFEGRDEDDWMRHNVRLLFLVCMGYGLTKGLTDFAVPLLAGHLAEMKGLPLLGIAATAEGQAVSLPMIASGVIMVASALPLLLLPPDRERRGTS